MSQSPFLGRHTSARPAAADPTVFIVSGATGDQVFASRSDAEVYAGELGGARVSSHVVRTSLDEAMLVLERRVTVSRGRTTSDDTSCSRRFVEDPFYRPAAADVEYFQDRNGLDWHIVGFGTEPAALATAVQTAVDEVCELSVSRRETAGRT